jgi:hypothetical protein
VGSSALLTATRAVLPSYFLSMTILRSSARGLHGPRRKSGLSARGFVSALKEAGAPCHVSAQVVPGEGGRV